MVLAEFKNISKIYRIKETAQKALDDVSFKLYPKEMVVILGPSGAGKSTILNLLGGMDRPSSGEIIVNGVDISKLSDFELTEYRAKEIGFVFQFYNLISTLTAYENVELMQNLIKNKVKAQEILDSVGLSGCENKFPNQLSGGEQQRVSIARALAKNPTLLLCDEPTGALDSKTGEGILKLLQNKCKVDGKTVVIVTHNKDFAKLANRVIYVKNGKIEKEEINEKPLSVEEVVW